MKKIGNLAWVLLLSLLMASCAPDLTPLNKKVDELEGRVTKLEGLMNKANTTIETLQGLIAAEAGKTSIVSYKPTDFGYDLVMSDGTILNLMNGRNGNTPSIGVQELNGTLYWTINGELMRDSNNQPIKAKAQDGTAGTTPMMKVDAEGYWLVSTDGGVKYEYVRDASGAKVRAKGLDATDTLSITETDVAIVITFGGKTFTINKQAGGSGSSEVFDPNKMAIEYVSKYGVSVDGKSFATSDDSSQLGHFLFAAAGNLFANEAFLKFHMPSDKEWMGIFPDNSNPLKFNANEDKTVDSEIIVVGKDQPEQTYKAEYRYTNGGIAYGIKFIDSDNKRRTAYRYQFVKTATDAHLLVTARLIAGDMTKTLDAVSKEDFWSANKDKDKTCIFPAAGSTYRSGAVTDLGVKGYYWSSASGTGWSSKNNGYAPEFSATQARLSLAYQKDRYGFAVRPFSNF